MYALTPVWDFFGEFSSISDTTSETDGKKKHRPHFKYLIGNLHNFYFKYLTGEDPEQAVRRRLLPFARL